MPLIEITMYPGRTRDQKRNLVRAIVEAAVVHAGATPEGVEVIIQEIPKEHWAVRGQLGE